jgi:hypothetical protein
MSVPYASFSEEIETGDHRFIAILFKLSNALITFIYEGDNMKLGTLAVAMPQFEGKTCISSILLGDRNMVLTKILAERLSNASNGIALVSTNLLEIHEAEISSAIFKLTQKLLDKAV